MIDRQILENFYRSYGIQDTYKIKFEQFRADFVKAHTSIESSKRNNLERVMRELVKHYESEKTKPK